MNQRLYFIEMNMWLTKEKKSERKIKTIKTKAKQTNRIIDREHNFNSI